MNKSIDQILSQVYELEGLLLLVENHGKNTNNFVLELIRQKAQKIAELSNFVEVEQEGNGFENKPTSIAEKDDDNGLEIADDSRFLVSEQEFAMLGSDTCCDVDEDIDIEEVIESEMAETNVSVIESEDEPLEDEDDNDEANEPLEAQNDDAEELYDEGLTWDDEDYNQNDEYLAEDIQESGTIEETSAVEEQQEELDDINRMPETEEAEENEEAYISEDIEDDNDDEDEIVTVEEALSRSLSKNLRQAFTLNDRFRYRRELFGNSDVEMTNTINLVETMESYAEAEEYFYGDLEWDKESPEVADFMIIIRNHFA